jgi:hypothetical protein
MCPQAITNLMTIAVLDHRDIDLADHTHEQLAIAPAPRVVDGNAGPVVPSNAASWKLLLANTIAEPKYKPRPALRRPGGKLGMATLPRPEHEFRPSSRGASCTN